MNIGQKLVQLSSVSIGSALTHLLSIVKTTGESSGNIPVTVLDQSLVIGVTPTNQDGDISVVTVPVETLALPALVPEDTVLLVIPEPVEEVIPVVVT